MSRNVWKRHLPSSPASRWAIDRQSDHLAEPPRAGLVEWDYLLRGILRIPCNVEGIPVAEKDEHATLNYPGGELELDVVNATEGSDGIALGSLLAKTGYTTYDEGFVNTASTKSSITYIDGDAGILRYRGYPIEQLAEKSTFIEVSYLLIYGELPNTEQLEKFTTLIQRHTLLHEDLKRFFDGFPRNAHPMPVLSSAVNALSAYYQDSLDPFDDEQVELSTT